MNDDPAEVDVLYANLEDSTGRLQTISDRVYEWFKDCEPRFLQANFDHVENIKLHVTLLNSRFRKGEEIGEEDVQSPRQSPRQNPRRTFDAREILKHFGDFDFGQVSVKEIHISQRFSTGLDGFYQSTRRLALDAAFFDDSAAWQETDQPPTSDPGYSDEPSCG